MTERWKRLKSGSDIRGVAVAEENAQAELTEDVGVSVGRAFARWLGARTGKAVVRIAVGRDSRVTGEALEAAMMRGLSFERAEVMHCGLCTTPAMFMTTVLAQCDVQAALTLAHRGHQRAFDGYSAFLYLLKRDGRKAFTGKLLGLLSRKHFLEHKRWRIIICLPHGSFESADHDGGDLASYPVSLYIENLIFAFHQEPP